MSANTISENSQITDSPTHKFNAVFLDRATFSSELTLIQPSSIDFYQVFDVTEQDEELIVQRCQDAELIITNKVILTRSILARLPKLKLIQLTATGMNNIDVDAYQEFGITLYNVAGYAVKSVPEHTFMLMLNAMRAGRHYHQSVSELDKNNQSTWQQSAKFCLMDKTIYDLEDKKLGIIGAGAIGRRVADIARAFGMTVLYAERQGLPPRNDEYTEFDLVLKNSDIISLHCELNAESHHLINEQTIQKMAKKPLIVNVARGGVVDSQAVSTAIINNTLFGYASDVFETEPMVCDDPLLELSDHPRVFFTPHNAWGSLAAQENLWKIACEQIDQFFSEDTVSH